MKNDRGRPAVLQSSQFMSDTIDAPHTLQVITTTVERLDGNKHAGFAMPLL